MVSASGLRRNKSKSFSFSSPKTASRSALDDEESDYEFDSDSSEAPDFNSTSSHAQTIQFGDHEQQQQAQQSAKHQSKLLSAEPGRGKIVFERVGPLCNLIGREFPQEEHVLSSSDISSVNIIITMIGIIP